MPAAGRSLAVGARSEYVAVSGIEFSYEAFTHDHEQAVTIVNKPAVT